MGTADAPGAERGQEGDISEQVSWSDLLLFARFSTLPHLSQSLVHLKEVILCSKRAGSTPLFMEGDPAVLRTTGAQHHLFTNLRRGDGGQEGQRDQQRQGRRVSSPRGAGWFLNTPAGKEGWERRRKGNWGRWKSQEPQGLAQKRDHVSPRSMNRRILFTRRQTAREK